MRRVVIDTNIYIDWFNAGCYEDILFQQNAVKHLSAVVLMELRAGAFSVADRRLYSASRPLSKRPDASWSRHVPFTPRPVTYCGAWTTRVGSIWRLPTQLSVMC